MQIIQYCIMLIFLYAVIFVLNLIEYRINFVEYNGYYPDHKGLKLIYHEFYDAVELAMSEIHVISHTGPKEKKKTVRKIGPDRIQKNGNTKAKTQNIRQANGRQRRSGNGCRTQTIDRKIATRAPKADTTVKRTSAAGTSAKNADSKSFKTRISKTEPKRTAKVMANRPAGRRNVKYLNSDPVNRSAATANAMPKSIAVASGKTKKIPG